MFKHTKIGATIGPSCDSASILEKMVKSGMNFARLNFAHGTYPSHTKLIKTIRAVEKKTGEPVAILQDLQGPRIRVGTLPEAGIVTKVGQKVTFDTSIKDYAGKAIPVDHKELHRFIKKDHRILIDDGRVEAVTIKVVGTVVTAKIVQADLIKSHKGINLPDSHVAIPALSDKDRSDLHFGVLAGVDMVGLSFVSSPKDIHDVRKLIAEIAKKEKITLQPIAIIAKIERVEAVAAIAEIVESADGVMVARGDLGLELPTGEVPVIQKRIIEEANRQAKPVIVATQLLNSMQTSRRPTRAEASDVANAVIDHADALLLTNETASGDYPVLAVKTMSDIIRSTESSVYDDLPFIPTYKKNLPIDTVLANAVRLMTDETDIHAVVAASNDGMIARLLSHVRSEVPVFVATTTTILWRQLNMLWGVMPVKLPSYEATADKSLQKIIKTLVKNKQLKKKQNILAVIGEPIGETEAVDMIEIKNV